MGSPEPGKKVTIVGVVGGEVFGQRAQLALDEASVIIGAPRHLKTFESRSTTAKKIPIEGTFEQVLDLIAELFEESLNVCVLASGDPGFFGIARSLSNRLGESALAIFPAPSSMSLAFAKVGLNWDDALLVSAHGRSRNDAVEKVRGSSKTAIFTSPINPPEALGKALLDAGCSFSHIYVISKIGTDDEQVCQTDLKGLATGTYPPLSILILVSHDHKSHMLTASRFSTTRPHLSRSKGFGLPETTFDHRNSMITKAEVRAIALSKLALPNDGVLWDIGAGSGSVGIECALLSPNLRVLAVERNKEDSARIRANALALGVSIRVIEGEALGVLESLPDPDRVFIGGGGIDVLDAVKKRISPTGLIVASYALLERAITARSILGNMVQISVSRAVEVSNVGTRLDPLNPVFLCWG